MTNQDYEEKRLEELLLGPKLTTVEKIVLTLELLGYTLGLSLVVRLLFL